MRGGAGLLLAAAVTVAAAAPPEDYRAASRLMPDIYRDYPVTVYCACLFDPNSKAIDEASCGLDVERYANRADRVEWEHVMPASYFGHMLSCWSRAPDDKGGREHCQDTSDAFNQMEADLYNLQPSVGALNAIRSNHPYGMVAGEPRDFGRCDFEDNGDVAEPPPWFRGDAARTWFYMHDTYGIPLQPNAERLLRQWAEDDPPDAWERERARRIGRIQGEDYTVQFD